MKTALVLGSGGARGWSHVGVIRALEEANISIDAVIGCSMGSLVGGIYVSGKLDEFTELAINLRTRDAIDYFMEYKFPRSGLVDGTKIVRLLQEYLLEEPIEAWPIPFKTVATDILTAEEVLIETGSATTAIRSSISIPGLFTPVPHGDRLLVDGGMVNPLPVSVARAMGAEQVIAVDINHGLVSEGPVNTHQLEAREKARAMRLKRENMRDKLNAKVKRIFPDGKPLDFRRLSPIAKWMEPDDTPNIFEVVGNMIRIFESQVQVARLRTEKPDLLIQPEVGNLGTLDFQLAEEGIQAGYDAAQAALKTLVS